MKFCLILLFLLTSCTTKTHEAFIYTYPLSPNEEVNISFEGTEENSITHYEFEYSISNIQKSGEFGVASNPAQRISVTNPEGATAPKNPNRENFKAIASYNGSLREAFEECLFKLREMGIQIKKKWVSQPSIRELGTTAVFETSEDVEEKLNREYIQLLYNFSISYKVRKGLPNPKKEDIDKIKYYTLIGVVGAPSPPQPFKLGKMKGIIVYEENKEPQYFQITEDEWKIIEEFNNEKE